MFLATSDEALPIMLSRPEAFPVLLRLLAVKFVAAAVFGLLTDLVLKRFLKPDRQEPFHDLCEDCDCEHEGIFKSALRHTVKIAVFLLLINLILGYAIYSVSYTHLHILLSIFLGANRPIGTVAAGAFIFQVGERLHVPLPQLCLLYTSRCV